MALFGLTAPAAKLVGEMADAYRQRGPLMTRKKRRVYPHGGSKLVLMQYIDTDAFLGCNDQTGVKREGLAERVDSLITGVDANDGTEYDVDATYMHNLVSPNGKFWARRGQDGIYYAVSGAPGRIQLGGEVDADGNLTITLGTGDITISFGNACGTSYVEGQVLTVLWDASGFTVIDECCPPSS